MTGPQVTQPVAPGSSGGGGGGGGTPATIVQAGAVGSSIQNGVVLGATPTPGNLLIAVVMNSGSANINGSGWTPIPGHVGASGDAITWGWKIAGSSESKTQTPTTDSNSGIVVVWEINNGTPGFLKTIVDVNSATQTIGYQSFKAAQLILGAIDMENSGITVSSHSGVDHITQISSSRCGAFFDVSPATQSSGTASVTFSSGAFGSASSLVVG